VGRSTILTLPLSPPPRHLCPSVSALTGVGLTRLLAIYIYFAPLILRVSVYRPEAIGLDHAVLFVPSLSVIPLIF
jgi:hypothetical protein